MVPWVPRGDLGAHGTARSSSHGCGSGRAGGRARRLGTYGIAPHAKRKCEFHGASASVHPA
eukprot:scaffold274085_cov28-Tisochrysis_lutea.AAC.4